MSEWAQRPPEVLYAGTDRLSGLPQEIRRDTDDRIRRYVAGRDWDGSGDSMEYRWGDEGDIG